MKKLLKKLFGPIENENETEQAHDESLEQAREEDGKVTPGARENMDPDHIKIIIVSDNHIKKNGLISVVEKYTGEVDYFLHCGDSNLEHDDPVMVPFITVMGNTDFRQKYRDVEQVNLPNGEQIWINHGDRYQVRAGVDVLVEIATLFGGKPSIILYGHTHVMDVQMFEGRLVINPGSIELPRDGGIRKYAKLEITKEAYQVTILNAEDHSVVKEFEFQK
ncbi:MAG: YfcE family phosphodiesterase [Turicibacter sp.]|nr:YfcE family phosphodiesterase [Turicibacter sp.]